MKIFAKGWSDHKDGPGHRRIYYLKGCNLHCAWCASPESISPQPQLLFYPDRKGDFPAEALCPHGAIRGVQLQREICKGCQGQECRAMRHPALEWLGQDITPAALEEEVVHAFQLWGDCAGVTFGGGEPTLQPLELTEAMDRLRARKIHTAMESNASTPAFSKVLPHVDLAICDLKAGTAENFTSCTGGNLAQVHENLEFAACTQKRLLLRIPVITGKNDSTEEQDGMMVFLSKLRALRLRTLGLPLELELLRLHHFGEPKYHAMGQEYALKGVPSPNDQTMAVWEQKLTRQGILLQKN